MVQNQALVSTKGTTPKNAVPHQRNRRPGAAAASGVYNKSLEWHKGSKRAGEGERIAVSVDGRALGRGRVGGGSCPATLVGMKYKWTGQGRHGWRNKGPVRAYSEQRRHHIGTQEG